MILALTGRERIACRKDNPSTADDATSTITKSGDCASTDEIPSWELAASRTVWPSASSHDRNIARMAGTSSMMRMIAMVALWCDNAAPTFRNQMNFSSSGRIFASKRLPCAWVWRLRWNKCFCRNCNAHFSLNLDTARISPVPGISVVVVRCPKCGSARTGDPESRFLCWHQIAGSEQRISLVGLCAADPRSSNGHDSNGRTPGERGRHGCGAGFRRAAAPDHRRTSWRCPPGHPVDEHPGLRHAQLLFGVLPERPDQRQLLGQSCDRRAVRRQDAG